LVGYSPASIAQRQCPFGKQRGLQGRPVAAETADDLPFETKLFPLSDRPGEAALDLSVHDMSDGDQRDFA
jgi:hypothetical protein